MDPALIAVIGTLGGVVVTSASGITVGWFTARSQRDNIDRQRATTSPNIAALNAEKPSSSTSPPTASFAKRYW